MRRVVSERTSSQKGSELYNNNLVKEWKERDFKKGWKRRTRYSRDERGEKERREEMEKLRRRRRKVREKKRRD